MGEPYNPIPAILKIARSRSFLHDVLAQGASNRDITLYKPGVIREYTEVVIWEVHICVHIELKSSCFAVIWCWSILHIPLDT